MRVVLDSCIAGTVYRAMVLANFDVEWIGNWKRDPGDAVILAHAHENRAILVTLDKDFGTLAIREQKPHCGILRLVGLSTRQQPAVCIQVLRKYHSLLEQGAIITSDSERVRIRYVEE